MKIRVLVCAVFLLAAGAAQAVSVSAAPLWEEVSAILQQRCVLCHHGDYAPGGLRLDSLDGVLAGSARGAVVVAGKPAESELVLRVRGERQPRMPMNGPPWLNDEEVARIEAWIDGGLPGEEFPAPATPEVKEEKAPPAAAPPPGRGSSPSFWRTVPAATVMRVLWGPLRRSSWSPATMTFSTAASAPVSSPANPAPVR